MPYCWPADTVFTPLELEVEDRLCRVCEQTMKVCDHRHRRLFTLTGPVQVTSKLVHCPDPTCTGHHRTHSPESETALAMPWWVLAWDVVCLVGHRRFARHWSIPQLRSELVDRYDIALSADALEQYVRRYQCMVAARHQDAAELAAVYAQNKAVVLAIDGLQPEKGHETLYVVRELTQKRVWFAEPLISSATAEVQALLVQARQWAERLQLPVALWLSDKQDAFVRGIAAEFADTPHRYCSNHFVLDLAKPMLAADSHAKVQMRSKVRGLRAIERDILAAQRADTATSTKVPAGAAPAQTKKSARPKRAGATPATNTTTNAKVSAGTAPAQTKKSARSKRASATPVQAVATPATNTVGNVVLDYCTTIRGILNDDQGGPLQPPGVRMATALGEVRRSLQRNLRAKKGGTWRSTSSVCPGASPRA